MLCGWIGRPSRAFPPLNPYVIVSHHTASIILLRGTLKRPHGPRLVRPRSLKTQGGPREGPSPLASKRRRDGRGERVVREASPDAPGGRSSRAVARPPGGPLGLWARRVLGPVRTRGVPEDAPSPRPALKNLRLMQVSPLSERDTGPYPPYYRGAFAFCMILYPPVCGTGCPGPSPLSPRLPRPRPGREGTEGQPTGLPSSGWDT